MVFGRGFDSRRLHQFQKRARPGNDPGRAFVFLGPNVPTPDRI